MSNVRGASARGLANYTEISRFVRTSDPPAALLGQTYRYIIINL